MKKKLKIIIPIVVVVVLIAVAASIYFFTDLFKSPKKLFYKYMGKTLQTANDNTYDDFLDQLGFYYNKSYQTNAEITVDGNLEDFDKIKDLKISLLSQVGPRQEESYSKIELEHKNNNLTTIEYLNSNNNYGLKCSDIYKDYFYVENKNLKALSTKLGIDSADIPDSISKINLYDLLYISKDTRKSIYNKYYKLIVSELDKDNFTAEKGLKIDVNGKEVKANSYTLTLSSQDICNILAQTFDTLKDDDETLDLFLSKYKMISQDIESADISKEDLKSAISEVASSFKNTKPRSSSKLKITIYESKGNTVRITLSSDKEVLGLDITKNKKSGTLNLYYTSNNATIISIRNEYTIDGDTTKGKIIVNAEDLDIMNIDYTYVDTKSKINLEAKITNSLVFANNASIEFKYEITGDNLNKKPTKFDINGYIKLVEDTDSRYIAVNFKGNTEYTDSIDIPKLGTSNGVCINTVTDDELETIKADINTNMNTFIDKILGEFELTRNDIGMPDSSINVLEALENNKTLLTTNSAPVTVINNINTSTLENVNTSVLNNVDTSTLNKTKSSFNF